jgi:DNA-binding CsgD family transcriptional regulator
MAHSPHERAVTLHFRDQLLQQLRPALIEARRGLASVSPDIWRAAQDAAEWLGRERLTLKRGWKLASTAYVLLDPTATEDAKTEAAAFLTHDLPPRLRQPSAWRAWKTFGPEMAARLNCSVDEALRLLLKLGIQEAARSADKPQQVRIGRRWVTDARGRIRNVVPREELDLSDLLAWLTAVAYRHAAETAGARPRASRGAREAEVLPRDAMSLMEVAARKSAARLRIRPEAERATRLLASRHLSPQQTRVVGMRRDGFTTAEIATALGCSQATVRVHLSHATHGRGRRRSPRTST